MNPYRISLINQDTQYWEVIGRYSTFEDDEDWAEWRVINKYRWRWLARLRAWLFVWWNSHQTHFGSFTAEAKVVPQVTNHHFVQMKYW